MLSNSLGLLHASCVSLYQLFEARFQVFNLCRIYYNRLLFNFITEIEGDLAMTSSYSTSYCLIYHATNCACIRWLNVIHLGIKYWTCLIGCSCVCWKLTDVCNKGIKKFVHVFLTGTYYMIEHTIAVLLWLLLSCVSKSCRLFNIL